MHQKSFNGKYNSVINMTSHGVQFLKDHTADDHAQSIINSDASGHLKFYLGTVSEISCNINE